MWLAIRTAAGKARIPSNAILADQLGSAEDARRYRKLVRDYPEIERGPDQGLIEHYDALTKAFERENAESGEGHGPRTRGLTVDTPRRAPRERAEPRVVRSPVRSPEELQAEQEEVASQPTPDPLPRRVPRNRPLAERDPGWYVSPESQSAGYGVPPMPRRSPGDAMRPSNGPGFAPDQQSIRDWVTWLRDKGIEVDHTLHRPDAVSSLPPRKRRAPTGPEIWMPLVDAPGYSGRQMVAAFVVKAITDRAHQTMLDNGWAFRGYFPGDQGSYYHKTIGDRIHVIDRSGREWVHSSGPADAAPDEFGDPIVDQNPLVFPTLGEAALYAQTGKSHAGFYSRNPSLVPDSSYQPHRRELTGPMVMGDGPEARGKFQTLSNAWEEK